MNRGRLWFPTRNALTSPSSHQDYEHGLRGIFHLVDSWRQPSNSRLVFKFKLVAVEGDESLAAPVRPDISHGVAHRRYPRTSNSSAHATT